MTTAVVVGAGLFGSVIAAELRDKGHRVVVIDDARPLRGSAPAACLMKPSWLSSLSTRQIDIALELLDHHYGVKQLSFRLPAGLRAAVHWVNPRDVLLPADIHDTVREVQFTGGTEDSRFRVHTRTGVVVPADLVVLACGAWANELLATADRIPDLEAQMGVAFTTPHSAENGFDPFISPWAPYKQLVAFKRAPEELWVGDGSAIKQANWTFDRSRQCRERCASAVDRHPDYLTALHGLRPYVKSAKAGLLKEVRRGLWVATGGAKNGTMYAALCADEITRSL